MTMPVEEPVRLVKAAGDGGRDDGGEDTDKVGGETEEVGSFRFRERVKTGGGGD